MPKTYYNTTIIELINACPNKRTVISFMIRLLGPKPYHLRKKYVKAVELMQSTFFLYVLTAVQDIRRDTSGKRGLAE